MGVGGADLYVVHGVLSESGDCGDGGGAGVGVVCPCAVGGFAVADVVVGDRGAVGRVGVPINAQGGAGAGGGQRGSVGSVGRARGGGALLETSPTIVAFIIVRGAAHCGCVHVEVEGADAEACGYDAGRVVSAQVQVPEFCECVE